MARSDFRFSTQVRVRYAEIDAQAVVFNSRYLEYADVAVTEYWRAVGLHGAGEAWRALEFHVARALIDYKAPIRFDEEIDLYARTARVGRSSLMTLIEIHGAEVAPADDVRASIEIINVNVDLATGKSCRLPDWVGETLTLFEAKHIV
jgi:acyl-CoA thioester hydrolase